MIVMSKTILLLVQPLLVKRKRIILFGFITKRLTETEEMMMWNKIKCFFGYHDWIYTKDPNDKPSRCCLECNKKQRASYDPMHGSTDWD